MKLCRSNSEMAPKCPVDVPLNYPGSLAERVFSLEQEKLELQLLVCELLSKNEELRREIRRLARGAEPS
jgi:hypothetical protein